MTTIVNTEKELECALERRDQRIMLKGPKAIDILRKIEKAEAKKRTGRNVGFGLALLFLAAAPFTGGASLLGLGATAGAFALSDAVIIAIITAVVSISVEAIRSLKEYKIRKLDFDRVEFIRK